ncbi:hypothetical protein WA158_000722 [Blastocystis sp. Blastoise]
MKTLVVLSVLFVALTQAVNCLYDRNGVTYDLSKLTGANEYRIKDTAVIASENRTLVFNVCANVVHPPRDAFGGNGCDVTDHIKKYDGTIETTSDPSPAYSVDSQDGCKRLALDVENRDNVEVSLYDRRDYAAGVVLTYQNGDFCCINSLCTITAPSSLVINWICTDSSFKMPSQAIISDNANTCASTLTIESTYACPTQCPVANDHLCNNHGSCGYDLSNANAHCYCNSGWYGESCNMIIEVDLMDINTWAILITILLSLIVIITVISVYLKLRKINVDPDAFENLETKFNELGQMTQF